jgi:hypothetical protein
MEEHVVLWSKCMLLQTMETLGLKTKILPRTRTSHFVNKAEVCRNPQILQETEKKYVTDPE